MHRVEIERDSGGVAVLTAHGELDAFAAPDLQAALAEIASSTRIVVDLRAVSFLDSTALGIVVHAVRELEDRGERALVVLPRGSARRIFEITTLDRALPIAAGRAQAVATLTSPA
jgi:anti-sigma B factor antagonist